MAKETQHPSHEELAAFTLGQLPLDMAEKVEQHVRTCDPCCETMMGLASDDTFVDLLQEVDATRPVVNNYGRESIPTPLMTHPRYQTESTIGRGGMGRVYRARHRMMDREVALKVIHSEWIRKQEAIDRFRREVKTAASLDHHNIVTAHDAEQAGDLHFLVMEYVDGENLAETVAMNGALPVAKACDFVRQAAEGLQYAHDRGMVHRDIKPQNLMVTKDNTIKILDFGLASLAPQTSPSEAISEDADGKLTIAGSVMGTPDFISPEQAEDARKVDGRSDIYSLGMTLYFLLAGRRPFENGSALDKLKLHAEAEPTPLSELR
ncbi:MAG: serine/threonine-protein kinase, partial [Planctomycetota bacterium]